MDDSTHREIHRLDNRVSITEGAIRDGVLDIRDHEERLRELEKFTNQVKGFTRAIVFLASSSFGASIVALVISLSKGHAG